MPDATPDPAPTGAAQPAPAGAPVARRGGQRSARRRAREFAMQGVYQWLLSHGDVGAIQVHIEASPGFNRADRELFDALLGGAIRQAPELDGAITPFLDRAVEHLSPVEHAVLLVAAYELRQRPEIPYRVVINEAVEVTKDFGGTDGFKYVNGVLDRVAGVLRPGEAGGGR